MRAGICSIQQALTAEALCLVKQAVNLAKRRGHAQVTPLHVASVMLATSGGLLRKACLQSHSHPLQCKALELCFNVALNRLPASTSSALLGPHPSFPSLSNALFAAFKRAQAHQRRGSIENQQQPILALKIEIEQLIISILDDPSVSRVMREAGFSSTQVKNRVEQSVSLEICSQSTTPALTLSSQAKENTKTEVLGVTMSQFGLSSHFGIAMGKPLLEQARDEDVMSVLNSLASKKRNTVIIGESLASAENVVKGAMEKLQRGHGPAELRSVRLISLPLFSLRSPPKEEVEQKLTEVKRIVKSYISRGVFLYLGDLKWVAEFWSSYCEESRSYYHSAEHIILELQRLVRSTSDTGRLWLVGTATFKTYMKCKAGHPSLEAIWELAPLTIPVGSLGLTLNLDCDSQSMSESKAVLQRSRWPLLESGGDNHLFCSTDCCVNLKGEVKSIACIARNKESMDDIAFSTASSLPSWLQKHKEEIRRNTIQDKECANVSDLCKKWNSFCGSPSKELPHYPEKRMKFASSPPSPTFSSHERDTNCVNLSWPVIFEPAQFPKEDLHWTSNGKKEGCHSKPELLSNPNSSPNSASSSEAMDDMEGLQSFKELNAKNLKILCRGLEEKVPWQKDIIPDVATSILLSRSGLSKQNVKLNRRQDKEESWILFLGADIEGKEKTARELARLVFGSQSNFVSIRRSIFSSTTADSIRHSSNKRIRDEFDCTYLKRFGLALNENPHRVFFLEDVEQLDSCSIKGIKSIIESGTVSLPGTENVPVKDAIIIFNCQNFSSVSRVSSTPKRPPANENEEKDYEDQLEEKNKNVSLDLNIAIETDNGDAYSADENEVLELVDRKIVFRIQELP